MATYLLLDFSTPDTAGLGLLVITLGSISFPAASILLFLLYRLKNAYSHLHSRTKIFDAKIAAFCFLPLLLVAPLTVTVITQTPDLKTLEENTQHDVLFNAVLRSNYNLAWDNDSQILIWGGHSFNDPLKYTRQGVLYDATTSSSKDIADFPYDYTRLSDGLFIEDSVYFVNQLNDQIFQIVDYDIATDSWNQSEKFVGCSVRENILKPAVTYRTIPKEIDCLKPIVVDKKIFFPAHETANIAWVSYDPSQDEWQLEVDVPRSEPAETSNPMQGTENRTYIDGDFILETNRENIVTQTNTKTKEVTTFPLDFGQKEYFSGEGWLQGVVAMSENNLAMIALYKYCPVDSDCDEHIEVFSSYNALSQSWEHHQIPDLSYGVGNMGTLMKTSKGYLYAIDGTIYVGNLDGSYWNAASQTTVFPESVSSLEQLLQTRRTRYYVPLEDELFIFMKDEQDTLGKSGFAYAFKE